MISVRAGIGRILIGKQLLPRTGKKCQAFALSGQCALISDSNVAPLFADRVKKSLIGARIRPTLITIPTGETSKTLNQAGAICDRMIAAGLDRQSFVVGLGGGMIGDLSPRHSACPDSNDAARNGGQLDRRKNRSGHARREEFDRRFPSTLVGD